MDDQAPTPDPGSDWINQLTPGQLAISRTIQMDGLTGQWSRSVFTWLKHGHVQTVSETHAGLSDAFDEAVSRLSEEFKK